MIKKKNKVGRPPKAMKDKKVQVIFYVPQHQAKKFKDVVTKLLLP